MEEHFIDAMEELNDLSSIHDFEVIVLLNSTSHDLDNIYQLAMRESKRHGFELLRLNFLWNSYVAANDVEDPDSAQFLSDTDWHASAQAHAAIGQGLAGLISARHSHCLEPREAVMQ